MIKVRRIRHTTFATADLGAQLEHYQSVIGFGIVHRDERQVCLGSDSDELAVVLERATENRFGTVGFEIDPGIELADLHKSLDSLGLKSDIRSDTLPGIPKTLVFHDPDGCQIELFSTWASCSSLEPIRGLAATKLGHLALRSPDPYRAAKFYEDVLGFRVSDQIEDNFVFLRCGFQHHAMNFARGDAAQVHHIAFELRDASHMHQACDLLGRRGVQILWGPVRHGPGHNVAIYHRDPDGYLIELYYDMDVMVDETLGYYEPRPWHRDRPQRPKTWVGLPRDIWGVGPAKEALEFSPVMRGAK